MRKDSARKNVVDEQTSVLQWILFAVIALVFAGLVYLEYHYKVTSTRFPAVKAYVSRVTSWIAERKSHLHNELSKVKQLAATQNNASQEVHFEFYTALPKMQVTVPEITRQVAPKPAIAANKAIVSVDELEKELASEIEKKH